VQQAVLNDECIALERGEGKREGKGGFFIICFNNGIFYWGGLWKNLFAYIFMWWC
jgi:hypothetical protein